MAYARLSKAFGDSVEFRDVKANKIEGYLHLRALSAALDTYGHTLTKWVKMGLFLPDFYTRHAMYFAESRLEEIKRKWADRRYLSQDLGPETGVITSFGVMKPRVAPKKEVLAQIALKRPKERLRHSYSKSRKHYNFKDLKL